MVRINKRSIPKDVVVKRNYYREEPANGYIFEDFNYKCYLCEERSKSVIEHFVAHRGNYELEHSWDNLFLACSYCNNIKETHVDRKGKVILDVTKYDPEEHIELLFANGSRKSVNVFRVSDNQHDLEAAISTTVDVLKIIHGIVDTTDHRKNNAVALLQNINDDIQPLFKILKNYVTEDDPDVKAMYRQRDIEKIRTYYSASNPFAGFKRAAINRSGILKNE